MISRSTLWKPALVTSVALACPPVLAQEQDLASKATDPTASLMAFNLTGAYIASFHGPAPAGEAKNQETVSLKPAIPFKAFGYNNIMRLTLPYQTGGRGREGMGDVSVFDILTFDQTWGRFAAGAVANFASDDKAADKFSIGPAIGAVMPLSKRLNVGLFSQNLFASNTAITQLQPIAAYQLGQGWSLSAGDLQFTYDWKRSRWINVPLGLQLGQVTKLGGQPVRWSINPQYNLRDSTGLPRWSVALTFTLLVPGS